MEKTVNTTKGLNQIEAFRPNYLKNASEILQKVGTLAEVASWIDSAEGIDGFAAVNSTASTLVALRGGGAAGFAVSMLLSVFESEINKMNSEFRGAVISQDIPNYNVNQASNLTKHSQFQDFSLLSFSTNAIEKFLTGEIRDLKELETYEANLENPNNNYGSLFIQFSGDDKKAYIHSVYISDVE